MAQAERVHSTPPTNTSKSIVPVFSGLSDGPYNPKALRRKLFGRVVGYSERALGELLNACAEQVDCKN
jgi:hypothetical protein